ncbi:MAG: glycosyltransferase family 87 protein [Candidatus Omnitrophota bacterium]
MKIAAHKRKIIFVFLAILFISLFFRYAQRAPKRKYCDFRVYYATAERFLAKDDIYSRPDEAITPFKYSPMFALLVAPLAFVSQKCASLIFFTISFFSLLAVFILSKKLIVKEPVTFKQRLLLYIVPAVFTSRFIFAVLDSGQVTNIIFFLVVLGLYLLEKKKEVLSAASIGLSTMFKYTSGLFLPYFVFRKKIKVVLFVIFSAALYCILPALHVGISQEATYLKKWLPFISETSLDKGSWYDPKNQSLYSFVLRIAGMDSPFRLIAKLTLWQGLAVAFLIGAFIYLLILIKAKKQNSSNRIDYALLFLCMALFNPNAWLANFVVFVFAYMVILYHIILTRYKDRLSLALMILSFMIASWFSESMVGDNLQKFFESLSTVTIGALLLVFVLLRLKFSSKTAALLPSNQT